MLPNMYWALEVSVCHCKGGNQWLLCMGVYTPDRLLSLKDKKQKNKKRCPKKQTKTDAQLTVSFSYDNRTAANWLTLAVVVCWLGAEVAFWDSTPSATGLSEQLLEVEPSSSSNSSLRDISASYSSFDFLKEQQRETESAYYKLSDVHFDFIRVFFLQPTYFQLYSPFKSFGM